MGEEGGEMKRLHKIEKRGLEMRLLYIKSGRRRWGGENVVQECEERMGR